MKIDNLLPIILLLLFSTHVIGMSSVFPYGPKLGTNGLKRFETKIDKLSNSFLAEMAELDRKGIGTDGSVACDVSRVYGKKIELLKIDALHPDDLATLALWAERRNPTFCASYVYEYVFETSVHKLGKLRNRSARAALQRVKVGIKKRGHYDAHLAETIEEAERDSMKK
jgi:hypothetical protein